MAAPSFSDVARAYSPDFTGIADEAFRGRQLAQQQQQFAQQMDRRRDAERNDYLSKIAIDPSKTPYDLYSQPQIENIRSQIYQDLKSNPKLTEYDLRRKYDPMLGQMKYGQGVATSVDKQIMDRISNAAKDNLVLDQDRLRGDMLRAAFYGEDGQLMTLPNGNVVFDQRFDLSDPENLARYSNPALANAEFAKRFKAGVTAAPLTTQVFDPSVNAVVPYTQELTPFDRATPDGIGRERAYNNISVGDKQYNLLTDEQAALMPSDNITRTSLLNAREKYKGDEEFESLPRDVQDRIVLADLVDRNIGSVNYGQPKWDREGLRMAEQKRQHDITNARLAQSLDLSRQRFAFDKLKYKEGQQEKERGSEGTFNAIVRLAADETPTPLQQKKLESFRVKPAAYLEREIVSQLPASVANLYNKKDESGKRELVQIYDISMGAKGHFIKDPETGSPTKVYMWVAPRGKKGIVEAKYRRKGNGEYVLADKEFDSEGHPVQIGEGDNRRDKYVNPYRIPGASIDQLLMQYQMDYLTPKREEAYQGDVSYLADPTSTDE